MISGRILYVDSDAAWLANGDSIFVSRDSGRSWQHTATLPFSLKERVLAATRLSRRLARAGVHCFVPHPAVAIANGHIFARRDGGSAFVRTASVSGSRPLAIATDGEWVCYGEYRSNGERSAIHIWASENGGVDWQPVWRFDRVRHVHGVYWDQFERAFWVTTGDTDEESGLWKTVDRFRSLDCVAIGSQQVRAVGLCFTREHVYFGSDTPLTRNYIYRLHRATGRIERLQEVGSSVFFTCRVGAWLFFSTAAEPSMVNSDRRVEVWGSKGGECWRLLRVFRKDVLPHRLFQYGQVQFPAGPGDEKTFYFTPFAVGGDQRTQMIGIAELDREFGG